MRFRPKGVGQALCIGNVKCADSAELTRAEVKFRPGNEAAGVSFWK